MEFQVNQDLENILELLKISQDKFASDIGISRITLNNWLSGKYNVSRRNINLIYEYAFKKGLQLNKIKEQFYFEDYIGKNDVLLFHGAKNTIEGNIDLEHNKGINDFGNGFYCGESLEQSAMFVASYEESTLYIIKFHAQGLKKYVFHVDRDWMLSVAYFRGRLKEYEDTPVIQNIIHKLDNVHYIIAPIADNRMFEIIDQFIDGEITDEQCRHCLSATNLGNQYVFLSQEAINQITVLEKCYLAKSEKTYYMKSKEEGFKMNQDKVKLARKKYRNQGKYIEEILER